MNIITPEAETQPPKSLSFTNGAIKRHHYPTAPALVISYKECLKNHAASLGGHALDGCGEFMPSPSTTPTDPTSIKCAACGCHRNFHRREPEENNPIFDFPPPQARGRSPNSGSPPPLSSSYYPSAPHILLALSAGVLGTPENYPTANGPAANGRKRFRSKFSQEQKEKMYLFSEKVGWKMQKSDEGLVEEFCNEVGVGKGVLKVWMHNNKHTLGKKDVNGSRSSHETNNHCNDASAQVATNASSSSS